MQLFNLFKKSSVTSSWVAPGNFKLIEGKEYLSRYQFDTKEAIHYYCTICGIQLFSNSRAAQEMFSINLKCLNDFDLETEVYKVIKVDGKNWDKAVPKLNKQLSSGK